MSNLASYSDDAIHAMNWYYQIELRPGLITKAPERENITATRHLLRTIKLDGAKVLDIGVMEGALPILMGYEGANVTGYDRPDFSKKVDLVKEAFGANFEYCAGQEFHEFAAHAQQNKAPFDVVVMSGVLYHVIDPLLFLHSARCLMTTGTIFVIETSCVVDEECVIQFNNSGRFYRGSNYYQVSTGWLDYCLRFMGFRILDTAYLGRGRSWLRKDQGVPRVALKCVLTDRMQLPESDTWAHRKLLRGELNRSLKVKPFAPIDATQRTSIACARGLPIHNNVDSVDVTRFVQTTKPMPAPQPSFILRPDTRL